MSDRKVDYQEMVARLGLRSGHVGPLNMEAWDANVSSATAGAVQAAVQELTERYPDIRPDCLYCAHSLDLGGEYVWWLSAANAVVGIVVAAALIEAGFTTDISAPLTQHHLITMFTAAQSSLVPDDYQDRP